MVKPTRRAAVLIAALVAVAVVLTGIIALDRNHRAVAGSTPSTPSSAGTPSAPLTPATTSSSTTATPSATSTATATPSASSSISSSATSSATSSGAASGASSGASSSAAPSAGSSSTAPAVYHQLIGLGDSVTAGTNCNCTDFVTDLAARLGKAEKVDVGSWNEGDPGATSADLLSDLTSDHSERRKVADSDVVIITTGANDLGASLHTWEQSGHCAKSCYLPDIQTMGTTVGSVVSEVEKLRDGQPTAILVTDYWNVYEDGSVGAHDEGSGFLSWSDTVTRAANRAICGAAQGPGVQCIDLYAPFKGTGDQDPTDLLSDDGDHPNAAGTKLIASTLYAALESSGASN